MPVVQLAGGEAIYDLTIGKYDLTVASGPSYTTRREEVTAVLTEVMRSVPDSAVFLAGRLARLLDLPDADELGREMDMLNPARKAAQASVPPQVQQQIGQMQQTIQQGGQMIQRLQQKLVEAERALQQSKGQLMDKSADRQLEAQKLEIEQFRAETERMKTAVHLAQ